MALTGLYTCGHITDGTQHSEVNRCIREKLLEILSHLKSLLPWLPESLWGPWQTSKVCSRSALSVQADFSCVCKSSCYIVLVVRGVKQSLQCLLSHWGPDTVIHHILLTFACPGVERSLSVIPQMISFVVERPKHSKHWVDMHIYIYLEQNWQFSPHLCSSFRVPMSGTDSNWMSPKVLGVRTKVKHKEILIGIDWPELLLLVIEEGWLWVGYEERDEGEEEDKTPAGEHGGEWEFFCSSQTLYLTWGRPKPLMRLNILMSSTRHHNQTGWQKK